MHEAGTSWHVLYRHLALLGEVIGDLGQTIRATPKLIEGLLREGLPKDPAEVLRILSEYDRREFGSLLYDFSDWSIGPDAKENPLALFRVGSVHYGEPEKDKFFLGASLCMVKGAAIPFDVAPTPLAVPDADIRRAMDALLSKKTHLEACGLYFDKASVERIMDFARKCQDAYNQGESAKLAEAILNEDLKREYSKAFISHYGKSLGLLRHLVKSECFEVKAMAKTETTFLPSKRRFLTPEQGGFGAIAGDMEAEEYARISDRHMVFHLLKDLICPEQVDKWSREEQGGGLPDKTRFAKAVKDCADWLDARGTSREMGLIIAASRASFDYALSANESYIPRWREPLESEGFGGRYRGYPIWTGSFFAEPLVAAFDLADFRPVSVRRCVIQEDVWCDAPEVSLELTSADRANLQQMLPGEHAQKHVDPRHYCKVVYRFFWHPNVKNAKAHGIYRVFRAN